MRSQHIVFIMVVLVAGAVASSSVCSEEEQQEDIPVGSHRLILCGAEHTLPSPVDPTDYFFPDDPESSDSSTVSLPNDSAPVSAPPAVEPSQARVIPAPSSTTSFYMSRPLDNLEYLGPLCRYKIQHDSDVTSVRLNWRVNRLLTVAGRFACLWYLENRARLGVRCFHSEQPHDAWFMRRDGEQYIISALAGGALLRWDAKRGFCKERKEAGRVNSNLQAHLNGSSIGTRGHTLAIDGKKVVIMDGGRRVSRISRKGKDRAISLVHDEQVHCARFSPNGVYVVTAAGKDAYVWQVARLKPDVVRQGENEKILARLYGARGKAFYQKP